MNKAERAIQACREAADALDDLPTRRVTLFGITLPTHVLRQEADWIEKQMELWGDAVKEAS